MSEYVKNFKVKDGDKDNNKLISFRINGDDLFEKYKIICTIKIEDLRNIPLNALPV